MKTDELPPIIAMKIPTSVLTPQSFAAARSALLEIKRDAIATAQGAERALVQLTQAARARGIRARVRPLENLTSQSEP